MQHLDAAVGGPDADELERRDLGLDVGVEHARRGRRRRCRSRVHQPTPSGRAEVGLDHGRVGPHLRRAGRRRSCGRSRARGSSRTRPSRASCRARRADRQAVGRRAGAAGGRRPRSRPRSGPTPARRAAAPSARSSAPGPARRRGPARSGSRRPRGRRGRQAGQLDDLARPSASRVAAAADLQRLWMSPPTRTLSRTDSDVNSSSRWKVRARPRRARLCGGSRVTSWPSSRTRPRVGRLEPGDDVEQRGLAGAVGTDQPGDAARLRRSTVVVVERGLAAEADA